ncbi:MAG: carbohydrate kinase [Spirochaetota bacterium]|nr:MAG: carbohydrate kinase [Spirochaetota bacterium]
MSKYYFGFDCGTMGTKVAIYAEDSTLVAEAYRAHDIKYPKPGWAEMEPDQFYRVVIEGMRECVNKSKIDPKDVRGISCSGIICGFLPIDDNWDPVGAYIPYLDGRAKEEVRYVSENLDPIWADESGNAEIGAYMPPMFLKWLINNEKDFLSRTKKVVSAAQYVMGKLGGLGAKDAFIDWAHMSGWVIGFDGHKRDWSEKQMELLDIPYEILPEVKKPWDVVGTLHKNEAEKIGLREGIPLVAGAGDIMQSNLGSGVVDTGMCSDVAGTASIFTFLVSDFTREVTDKRVIINGISTLDDQFMYWSFIPAGGLSLRWFRDEVVMRKDEEAFYEEMNSLAEKTPIGADFSLFFPYLQGRSAPAWPNASAAWLGMFGSNNSATLWRSILESIAFEYLSWITILRNVGNELKKIVGTGGGSKGGFWNQIKADVLDAPYVTLERTEGAVLGNALLAAYGVGDIKDLKKSVNDWIKVKQTFKPIEENNQVYMKIYKKREEILNGPLKEIFDNIIELHNIQTI